MITQAEIAELVSLYHLAQTGLASIAGVPSKYDRMCWAAREFARLHPETPAVRAYKALDVRLA